MPSIANLALPAKSAAIWVATALRDLLSPSGLRTPAKTPNAGKSLTKAGERWAVLQLRAITRHSCTPDMLASRAFVKQLPAGWPKGSLEARIQGPV